MGISVPSGLFVTLFDEATLNLYLNKGIYGFHMPPVYRGEPSVRSKHYAALADYACAREGTHVFFFLNRTIVYGGQVIGSDNYGAFYLNGPYSPIGRIAQAKVYWDESCRRIYESSEKEGVFRRPHISNEAQREIEVCQPYLLRFRDKIGLKGNAIESDQLYFELGEYPYPLPSNSIAGMGFCTLTPGETEKTINLLKNEPISHFPSETDEDIELKEDPLPFKPEYGISKLRDAISESHLEANVIANPTLLPEDIRPKGAAICRQVPISPFKPFQMDRADICYYTDEQIGDGTIPNTVIELKTKRAGSRECNQIVRYLKWLHKRLGNEAERIKFYLLAPSFARTATIPKEYKKQVKLVSF